MPILLCFCLLFHTSSVFFLSSCCSKISLCCHHPILHSHSGVSGSPLLPFLSPSHSMQTGVLSCSPSSVTPGLTPITALIWLQFCLLFFPAFGFFLLLLTQRSSIRKRFIFIISGCNSGAGRGGESAPCSSCLRAGQLECGPEQSSIWGCAVSLCQPGNARHWNVGLSMLGGGRHL